MRTKIFLKKATCLLVTAFMAVTAGACFDLGDYEDEEEYYNSFGDVKLVYQKVDVLEKDIQSKEYDVRDYFYNKNTGENFEYGDPKDDEPDEGKTIPQYAYVYMAVPFEDDVDMDSFALFFNATTTASLRIAFYVVDDLPGDGAFSNIKLFGDPETQEKKDDEGNTVYDDQGNPVMETIVYDDPPETCLVTEQSVRLQENVWDSIVVESWKSGRSVSVKDGQYLLMKFINNSGARGVEELPVCFRVTNMLVRAME